MKIHLIKEKTIRKFIEENSGSKISLEDWLIKVKFADWEKPLDMKKTFPSADLLGNHSLRVVFDISGNRYRMICKYAFGENEVHLFVCWIGTHAAYDKICKGNQQYTINYF
jgi:mRNA interferase HigB